MEITNTKKIVVTIFALLAIVILCGVYFYAIKNKKVSTAPPQEINFDWALQANALPKTIEAKAAFASGEYQKAYLLFKEAASSTDDFNIKSTLEISAAGTFMNIDRKYLR